MMHKLRNHEIMHHSFAFIFIPNPLNALLFTRSNIAAINTIIYYRTNAENINLSEHQKSFSQCLENTINTLDASNSHKSHKQQNVRGETQTILIHYWQTADDILFMPRYESMRKSAGSFIKWYIKGAAQ